jgi:hypothetical protein
MEEKRKAYMFLLGNLKEGHCLEERCVEWILILKLSLKTEDGGLSWIYLAQDSDNLQAIFSVIMNLLVRHVRGISLLGKEIFVS